MQRFALVLLALVLLASPVGVRAAGQATIAAVRGDVRVGDLPALHGGELVSPGTALRTTTGTLSLTFASGLAVDIYPSTTVHYDADDGAGRVEMTLTQGAVAVRREGNVATSSRFSVMTPQVVTFLQGTTTSAAIVSLPDRSNTNLFVTEGRASLRGLQSDPNANGISLPAGNMSEIDASVHASDPRPFTQTELPVFDIAARRQGPTLSWWIFGIIAILGIIAGRWAAKRKASC